ncbi:AraC family transcriptional regulator [Treponema sp. OMZ 840]|uniref:AraC family transcriptional regulator n=1 Tax=Treponema sp. OMZ 840 TaxID=244313 RepID=UPI003D8E2AE7
MTRKSYKNSFKNLFSGMSSLTVYRSGQQRCDSGFHRGFEVRPFYLLHYIIDGCGTYFIEKKTFPVLQGQAFLIFPGTKIDYRADFNTPWEYCWVGFNGADAQLLVSAAGFSIEKPVVSFSDTTIKNMIIDIYKSRGNQSHKIIMMTAKLYTLLSYMIEQAHKNFPASSSDIIQFKKACTMIEKEYMHPLTIAEIADRVGISRSGLYRAFISNCSASPSRYLTEYRIRTACILLTSTDLPIKEISYRVGIIDPMYFARIFKSTMSKSPREYRKNPISPGGDFFNILDKNAR